jgi:gamma-glutamyltranspeptidase/glutathione hydrolase
MRRRELLAAAGAGALAVMVPGARAGDRPVGQPFAGRSPVMGTGGAVATSQPLATQAALEVLREGGTAADAAVCAAAVLAVVEPMMSGPGGDLFALVWDPRSKSLDALESAGSAPRSTDLAKLRHMAEGPTIPAQGALSVTVSGAIAGWGALHARMGRLPFPRLLEPAIDYARDGAPVGPQTSADWDALNDFKPGPGVLGDFAELRRVFGIGGAPPKAGVRFRNPDIAHTLSLLHAEGPDAFYRGDIARAVVETVHGAGGFLEREDLEAHRPRWTKPITAGYRGLTIAETPPPSQGVTALQILRILERFDIKKMGFASPERLHVLIEAIKLSFADRARMIGDDGSGPQAVANMLSDSRISRMVAAINPNKAMAAPPIPLPNGDTTYLAVADGAGGMVSVISSLGGAFGSGLVAPGFGFAIHNRGVSFSLSDGSHNQIAPGRRPFHTIIPAFALKDGAPLMAFGVMGGSMQPQGHAQIVSNLVDFGMDLQEAGDAPRVRFGGGISPESEKLSPAITRIETGLAAAAPALRAKGHTIEIGIPQPSFRYGGYEAVMRGEDGVIIAATEMRQDGHAAAY